LERYGQQYELEHGDDEVFQTGEDEIDDVKSENQQQLPIESYYTVDCKRQLQYELASGIAKETDDFSEEDEIDQQRQTFV